jgi:hypothetical protein
MFFFAITAPCSQVSGVVSVSQYETRTPLPKQAESAYGKRKARHRRFR